MSWKKWLKRTLLAVALALVTRTIWYVGEREWIRGQGNRELAAAVAETEAIEPGWSWDSIATERRIPPPKFNSAELIRRVMARLAPEEPLSPPARIRSGMWEPALPALPNEAFPAEAVTSLRSELTPAQEAIELARSLKDYPNGNRVIYLAPDVLSTKLQDTQDTRTVARLLRWDAVLAITDGDRNRAADDLLASLNTSRSVGDEPFLISQLVRIATRSTAARSAEWVLGQSELPEARLAGLQAAWAQDAEEPLLLYGIRGERAAYDVLLRNLADGTITPDTIAGRTGGPSFGSYAWWLYRGRIPRERAFYHRWLTQAVATARLPIHEQRTTIGALPPPPGDDMKFAQLLLPAFEKVAMAHWRSVAESRCVTVGLACERYRLRIGRWPGQLSELTKDLLPAVPLDPFDGAPLRYRILDDGVVVYSVGKNGVDDGGALSHTGDPEGKDVGMRLWNPSERGKAPVPPER